MLSFWGSDLLLAQLRESDFRGLYAGADLRVLGFTALLAALSVCVFGLLPALAATRSALLPRLRQTASAGGGRSRLQGILVVAQLSLSLVLLLAAGLSLRALQKASALDLGFNPRQMITASYDLVLQNYPVARREVFRRELVARLEALPGVTVGDDRERAAAQRHHVQHDRRRPPTIAESRSKARAYMNAVGPRYFTTLEMPLVAGREIGVQDGRGAPGAAVINETLARRLWPGADSARTDDARSTATRSKSSGSLATRSTTSRPRIRVLSCSSRSPSTRRSIVTRPSSARRTAPALVGAAVQAEIRALDPALPVFDVRSFDGVLKDRADKQRGVSALFAGFGLLALLLAALGLYGVMAYAVTRRTREMGVRLALGATPGQLTRLIAGDGLRLALTGVAIGGTLALPLAQVLGALIFGVQIADLAAFAGTCALLVAVALVAALLPARRAARLDPIVALRNE